MPRKARIDAPRRAASHYRQGCRKKKNIFRCRWQDEFSGRLEKILSETETRCFARAYRSTKSFLLLGSAGTTAFRDGAGRKAQYVPAGGQPVRTKRRTYSSIKWLFAHRRHKIYNLMASWRPSSYLLNYGCPGKLAIMQLRIIIRHKYSQKMSKNDGNA